MSNEVVIKAFIHCEGCANQLRNILRGVQGVENINVDQANCKVTVKGEKLDHMKIFARIKNKYSRNVELLHPKPTNKNNEKKQPEKKKQEPKVVTVVLKMFLHCEGCAQDVTKDILNMKGVYTVEPNMEKSLVTVKGEMEPTKIVEMIQKRHRKHAVIVKQQEQQAKQQQKQDSDNNQNYAVHFPYSYYFPVGHNNYFCPNEFASQNYYYAPAPDFASDENVNACSIM